MADFRTHIGTATVIGALASVGCVTLAGYSPSIVPAFIALTALGGIMPDIDSDHSTSVRLIFTLLGFVAAAASFWFAPTYLSSTGVLCLAFGLWIAVRDVLAPVFKYFSRHRASWHSLVAVAFVSNLIVIGGYHGAHQPAGRAWLMGGATALGMLVHLLLDECFSVDLAGHRLKRSFGTAFKLYDNKHPITATTMLLVAVLSYPWWPPLPYVSSGAPLKQTQTLVDSTASP